MTHPTLPFAASRYAVLIAAAFLLSACAQTPIVPDDEKIVPISELTDPSFDPNADDLTDDEILALDDSKRLAGDEETLIVEATRDDLTTMFPKESRGELVELPPPETDLWEVIVEGYAIPEIDGPLVRKWERWYADRPDYFERMIDRSKLFLYHVTQELKERHMPTDLALLPMIESAYNPNAHSRSRAMGIWQFIPSTGRLYGLKQNWWMDERRDVVSATGSALDYLQKLYNDFNSWHLALAAYNWGEGNVSRAQARNRARHKGTSYAALTMPAETRNYVPKLQAVKNIIRDPGKYGLTLDDVPDAPYFTVVKTTRRMDVDLVASLAEMSVEEFKELNPQHNRPVIAGADEFTLLLPIDKADIFASKLELVDQPLVTWQAYQVRKGETLAAIADKFNSTEEALRAVNGLGRLSNVRAGFTLLVPAQQPSAITEESLSQAVFTTLPSSYPTTYYRVKRGDTLSSIAKRFGVSTQELMRLNGIKRASALRAGKNIRIAPRAGHATTTASAKKSSTASKAQSNKKTTKTTTRPKVSSKNMYRVKRGDTLSDIAKEHGITLARLRQLNNLGSKSRIQAGQTLRIR